MRRIRTMLVLAFALPLMVMAADKAPKLEPLPEPPPPPNSLDVEPGAEPQVTIIKKGKETVEEYRINGELYMMKITPAHGVPYYLMKEDQEGGWSRLEGPNPPLIIPKWVLFNF